MLAGTLAVGGLAVSQTVPTDIQQPGTQPLEIPNLISPEQCDNCHGGYDEAVEPAFNWRGSMMAHAAVDPLYWAAVAVSEQTFEGSGDLCLRCHIADGWFAGRSVPTDGSGLHDNDATGVSCHVCHKITNADGTEHPGVQNPPFVANDGGTPVEGYYGSSMLVMLYDDIRLGPYDDAAANHNFAKSNFHRSVDFCGTCHDVSNPAVGDLAHNNGAQVPLDPGTFSGQPGSPVDGKAAFNNPAYSYGVVERTFSEYKSSLLPETLVSEYPGLPQELQAGAIEEAYLAATAARPDGNYLDGDLRYFSCQTCHMRPVSGKGCKQNQSPVRDDLPSHDLTGGNYWAPDATAYLSDLGRLQLGGSLDADVLTAMAAGKTRALHNLNMAASLSVEGDTVRVTNLTGHKLITGYPEGRRMWLNVEWYDDQQVLLREDGEYGSIAVMIEGSPVDVNSLIDLDDPNARVYETHYGMTQEWAAQLIGLGYPPGMALGYDRITEAVTHTLGELAAETPGTIYETFHFVLNNAVLADNRIPPYGMRYDIARVRNALPVPADQYGDPGAGGTYLHFDDVVLEPPVGAASATIDLLYQPTSWEYIQFLHLANDEQNPALEDLGDDLLEAWLNTGMADPAVMTSTTWASTLVDCNGNGIDDTQDIAAGTSPDGNGNGVPDECEIDSYCTAKRNSLGCRAKIAHDGSPTITGLDDFVIGASDVIGQTAGGLLWSLSRSPSVPAGPGSYGMIGASPLGARLCIARPLRTGRQDSGGTVGECDGSFTFHFSQALMGAHGLTAGTTVYAQWLYDDPDHADGTGVVHTDALSFVILP